MSKDCLLKVFRADTQNNNLPELGTIKIPVLNSNSAKKPFMRLGGYQDWSDPNNVVYYPITVAIEDGSLYNYGEATNLGDETDSFYGYSAQRQYIAGSDTIIRIKNKYNLNSFGLNKYSGDSLLGTVPASFVFDIEQLQYCNFIQYFAGNLDCKGNIEKAFESAKGNFTRLILPNGKITGEIKNMVANFIRNKGVQTGSIADFSATPITTPLYSANDFAVTLNGTKFITSTAGVLGWSSAEKVYFYKEIASGSQYTTTVQYTGYTLEEIKEVLTGKWNSSTRFVAY